MSLDLSGEFFEKRRPGHRVTVQDQVTENGVDHVVIRHVQAHNKRTQSSLSIITEESFLQRYSPVVNYLVVLGKTLRDAQSFIEMAQIPKALPLPFNAAAEKVLGLSVRGWAVTPLLAMQLVREQLPMDPSRSDDITRLSTAWALNELEKTIHYA